MPGLPVAVDHAFAQAPVPAAVALFAQGANPQPGPNLLTTLMTFAPVILLFYFLMIRPQMQQEKKRRGMLGALKKNDRVVTGAGMYGTVVALDTENDKVTLRIDPDNLRMTFSRQSIVRVIDPALDKAGD